MTDRPLPTRDEDRGPDAVLLELEVADAPAAWRAAGFAVDGDACRIGATTIRLTGGGGSRGIRSWAVAGLGPPGGTDGDLDGLPTHFGGGPGAHVTPTSHPNGTTGLDHVVVATPDLERTIAALGTAGLACRRIRETSMNGSPMRQAFFRLGATVLEVVSGDLGGGAADRGAPARWWGLTVDVDDLDATAVLLGDALGRIKAAVQPGRRIATVRTRDLDVSVALAAMDHHGGR